jgi:hypothetical protein
MRLRHRQIFKSEKLDDQITFDYKRRTGIGGANLALREYAIHILRFM